MELNIETKIPVQFSAAAISAIKEIAKKENALDANKVLRVGVKGGGCSGMTYVLEFDAIAAGDLHFEIERIPIVMNSAHQLYLEGMFIDYGNGLNDRGFVFKNPNATSSCGCGTSFAV